MKAVILAGGNGSRLKKYNYQITGVPKPMLKIGDMPLLELIIKQLARHGFNNIVISTGHLSEVIEQYFRNSKNVPKGVRVSFSKQNPLLGTAGPLSIIPDLNETFLVVNGDILTNLDFRKFFNFHKEKKGILTLAVKELKLPPIGIIESEGEILKGYYERSAESYLDSMSIFICEPEALKYLKENNSLNLDQFINMLSENKERVIAYKTEEFYKDIGTDEGYEKALDIFAERKNEFLN